MFTTENPDQKNKKNQEDPINRYWVVERVTLKTPNEDLNIDLTNSFLRIEINSGISSAFTQGSIIFEEFSDLQTLMGLSGNEVLEINIKSIEGKEYSKRFKVLQIIPPLKSPATTQKIITIKFASFVYYNNMLKSFSKAFNRKKATECVKQIYRDYMDDETTPLIIPQETDSTISITIPYRKPKEAIDIITKYSSFDGLYDYVFYEDIEKCVYVPLSVLKEKEKSLEFVSVRDNENRDTEDGSRDVDFYRKKIISYSIDGDMYNIPKNINSGNYAATNINLNMTLKEVTNRIFIYENYFAESENNIESSPIIPKSKNEEIAVANTSKITVTYEPTLTSDGQILSQNILDSFYKRKSVNNIFKQILSIKTHSRCDLLPGEIIGTSIIGNKSLQTTDNTDKYVSGNYMVLSCIHIFEKTKSESTFILGRDSIPQNIPSEIEVSEEG